jgi:hypothetical protein
MRSRVSLPIVLRVALPVLAAVLCSPSGPAASARPDAVLARAFTVAHEDGGESARPRRSIERDAPAAFHARLPMPRLGAREIRGGRRVTLRWDALPPAVEELEILLSLDDGRSFGWRISPEIAGSEGTYPWDVPSLNAPAARVRIRAHVGGREVDGPVGPAFSIVADPALARDRWSFREGGMAAAAASRPAPHRLSTHPGARELHAPSGCAPVGPPVRAPGASPVHEATGLVPQRAVASDGATRPRLATVTRLHPLRN